MSKSSEPTFESWAAAQKQRYKPTDEQLAAFRDLFGNASPSAAEMSEIASCIARPCIKPWDGSPPITDLWCVLKSAVDELPSQSDKLVALLLELQRLPDGKGVMGPDPWFVDLPLFDNFVTEWWDVSYPDPHEGRQAWANENAFLAKLTAQAGGIEMFVAQSQRGGVCLRRALERTPWDQSSPTYIDPDPPMEGDWMIVSSDDEDSGYEDDESEEGAEEDEEGVEDPNLQITVLDVLVPAAAQWIRFCPRELYEKAVAGVEMDMEYDCNGTNFGTKMGWSLERWEYWRKRFEEVSTMEMLEVDTRRIAKEAAERMSTFSQEHT
ncbi:hypothetical protein PG997_010022 [Apiospora hydei]|uniref:Knr4/Smi1-like domain-containing protein n=1 Tax=Apiospora hydei TaxID=1337664 RepID=A0ABR1VVU7_9PEZI